jgi:hypothetical protein
MAIELSNITFTEQDDVVPKSGVEKIFNTGIVDTRAGNDRIIGVSNESDGIHVISGSINTGNGNDTITGSAGSNASFESAGININGFSRIDTEKGKDVITGTGYVGIRNSGLLNTGDDNDFIKGESIATENPSANGTYSIGIYNSGTINTGDGNDEISSSNVSFAYGISNVGLIDTGDGNDHIDTNARIANNGTINTGNGDDGIHSGGFSNVNGVFLGEGNDTLSAFHNRYVGFSTSFENDNIIETGDGNDSIMTRTTFTINTGIINTGNGDDGIYSEAQFRNEGNVFLGDGNDSINESSIANLNFIGTGDGNDRITSNYQGVIYNEGVIETGNGDDSILVNGTGTGYGIYNNGGAINMGDGNDSIIANKGFESGPNSSGAWFLGEGDDYIKGYGSGDFYGGNGNDTLELTSGSYTVGIWGEGGESPIFTKGNQLMITSEFEKLKAGSTIYDFTSLTAGQIIVVA